MYISLDLKFLDKNRAKMVKTSVDNMGDDGKTTATLENTEDKWESYEFNDGKLNICWSNELGSYSIDYPLTDDEMMEIVKHMKAKGEKIRRLIKLAEVEE